MNNRGFTLVETLVSFALVAVVSIFLFQIVSIVRNVYIEKGVKSEMVLDSSNISNLINKDIFNSLNTGNDVISIYKVSDNNLLFTFEDGSTKNLIVDNDNKQIKYGLLSQDFLAAATIGNPVSYYGISSLTDTFLTKMGIISIDIPINYDGYDMSYDVRITFRYDPSVTTIGL